MRITEDWLRKRYVDDVAHVDEIAKDAGCGPANIRRFLKKWKIRRGKIALIGKPAWNSGLTKETDPRLAALSEARAGEGNPMYGVKAWNAGLTKETDERLEQVAEKNSGIKRDEATIEKLRLAKLGKRGPESNAWKGGVSYSNGYGVNRLTVDGRRVYTHRHKAEVALGRTLSTEEHVHHIDRDKMNNDPLNLIVLREDDHCRLHRAIEAGHESRESQIAWLKSNGIVFEELVNEDHECEAA